MSSKLDLFLNQAESYYKSAIQDINASSFLSAKRNFLLAAEELFLAAGKSEGRIKQARINIARNLLERSEQFDETASKNHYKSEKHSLKPLDVHQDEDKENSWLVKQTPSMSLKDVAGLEDVKEQLRIKLIYPFTKPEFAKKYKINSGGGLLLYGPPGTGKTMIARAVAGEIDAAFYAIKPSAIMSKWVGEAEQNLFQLFRKAEEHPISIVFIDEMESLAPQRRSSNSSVMARVVPQLLAELDGFEKHKNPVLTIGATNEPWKLDPAIVRPGRLDRLIYIPPPDINARLRILQLSLAEIELDDDVVLEEIAKKTQNFSGADMTAIVIQVSEKVFSEAVRSEVSRPINQLDFDKVLERLRPSISVSELAIYEHYAKTGEFRKQKIRG